MHGYLNNHQNEVGVKHYDGHRHGELRAQFIQKIEKDEGGCRKNIERDSSFEKKRQFRKKQLMMKDKQAKIKYAENVMLNEQIKKNANVNFSQRVRVRPNDR